MTEGLAIGVRLKERGGGGGGEVTLRCKEVRPPLEETEIGRFTDPSGPILLPLSTPYTFLERMRLGVSRLEIS